ncbi:hypothetical protein M378DRAFT_859516 [Amanita muscaria Koide BX008]|uniref:Uncharacterized protein n=1 Tax=Amanita muscaria (strain Koide BX008) TaxID=946122 RepID=A0A0C2WXY8_AMAMK|nr:hypothetical protein M378DRAFT_859516 [Amanita muscaria Koide BX008]
MMDQVIKNINNLARTKRPIAGRRLNNFEGRQLLPDPVSIPLTSTNPSTSSTSSSEREITRTFTATAATSATLSSSALTNSVTPTTFTATAATSATLSSSVLTNSVTPTPAPSQIHDYKIPLIVVVCISVVFILTTASVFIIRHLRKTWQVQTGEARSTIFGIHIPQPRPVIGGIPHEQQPSSSEKVDRYLPRPVAMGQHARRDQQPVSVLPPQQQQQSSSQVGHLQRQLVHAAGAQDLSDHEEPPGYVP